MGTRGPFPRGKGQPGRDAENSPHLEPRSLISVSYTSSPLCTYIGVLWDCFTFTNVIEEHNAFTLMVNFEMQHSAKTLKTAIYTCLSLIVLIIYYKYTKLFLKATSYTHMNSCVYIQDCEQTTNKQRNKNTSNKNILFNQLTQVDNTCSMNSNRA
jgi:hypothetical protein